MKKSRFAIRLAFLLLLVTCLFGMAAPAQAQAPRRADSASTVAVNLVNMTTITAIRTDSGEFNILNGDVILQQGTDTLYCDSAVMNNTTHNFEAFRNVRIAQAGGTHGTSDYLKYTSAAKQAYMNGSVKLTDGKNNLDCGELQYNLGTKMAVYDKGGRLYNDSTTVTSRSGEYNIKLKEARFKGNVVVRDTQYHIVSEDLKYNTETKITVFYAHSIVTRDSGRSQLETSNGWYDGKLGIAHFKGHSSIWNDGQYIEGDSLYYNRQTGYGIAVGNVITIDTGRHATMYCGYAIYHQKQRTLLATIKPVLVQANGKDTLYLRADTFYSAPMVRIKPIDTLLKRDSLGRPITDTALKNTGSLKADSLKAMSKVTAADSFNVLPVPVPSTRFRVPRSASDKGDTIATPIAGRQHAAVKKKKPGKKARRSELVQPTMAVPAADTATADTTAPLYFIGYHHALIFSDSLQGKCDSICYTRADSLIRMMHNPVAWAHHSQITGDTIIMQLDSSTLRRMFVPGNALIVSQSGPEQARLWDQVQGRTLTAYFKDNTITQMIVKPEAECIYYSKDDKGAYLGVVQTTSPRMFVYFENEKIKNIRFEKDTHLTFTPLEQADLSTMKLSKFKWLMNDRPKTKEELFK